VREHAREIDEIVDALAHASLGALDVREMQRSRQGHESVLTSVAEIMRWR
jgi:hypothetical protein